MVNNWTIKLNTNNNGFKINLLCSFFQYKKLNWYCRLKNNDNKQF